MHTFEEDKALRHLLGSVSPESPGKDFSGGVMNRIFEEKAAWEQVKREPVFTRGFWIILALFAVLILLVIGVSGSFSDMETASPFLSKLNTGDVVTGYKALYERLGALPASIAGIFLGGSLLVFLEKWRDSRQHAAI